MASRYQKSQSEKIVRNGRKLITTVVAVLALIMGVSKADVVPTLLTNVQNMLLGDTAPLSGTLNESNGAKTKVHFVDVGQADAVLLEQDGLFALIDAGDMSEKDALFTYLEQVGVDELEYVVMTHQHADHINKMDDVLKAYPVNHIILPDFSKAEPCTTKGFLSVLEIVADKQIPGSIAKVGDVYPLGDGTITIVSAGVESEDEYNNLSVSTLFVAEGMRYLSCGDAEVEQEDAMLASGVDLQATLFKASHHGSSSSNTKAFLAEVNPTFAVASCGLNNDYGHPHREVVQAFEQARITFLTTAEHGTCIAYVNEQGELCLTAENQPELTGEQAA